MASTQIRGNTQIMAGTILDAQIAAAAGIATTKLADGAKFIKSDGTVSMLAALQMGTGTPTAPAGSFPIQQLANPVNAQDAATKSYVDSAVAGIASAGNTVLAATTVNITLSGTQTIDGIAISAGQKVLVKNQTSAANNGIYLCQSGAWTRDSSMNNWSQVAGMIISVEEGTSQADTVWLSTADPGGTLGTTPITFVQLPGPSDIIAGQGLTRTGQTLNVTCPDQSLTLAVGAVSVKLDTTKALLTTASGIAIQTNNSLNFTGNKLNVDGGVVLWKTDLVVRETVGGTVNGSNTAFTLANSPVTGSEMIYQNGLLLESGAGNDYTISGQNITMLTAPATGDRLKATYMKGATPVTPT